MWSDVVGPGIRVDSNARIESTVVCVASQPGPVVSRKGRGGLAPEGMTMNGEHVQKWPPEELNTRDESFKP
jgi:hypothetical protein